LFAERKTRVNKQREEWAVGECSGMLWRPSLKGCYDMLYTIIAVLVVLWLVGFIGHIGGGLIHILLVAAVVIFIFNLLAGRRTAI
jgi:hypothetical protein